MRLGRWSLAASTYSFHRLGRGPEGQTRPSLAEMVDRCAALGLNGIEILGLHLESTAPEDLARLRQRAGQNGLAIVAVSAHHNFVTPDPAERQRQIAIVCRWIDVAATLGAFGVRVFGGRWGTVRDFAALMAARGVEPPLPGYSEDEAYAWTIAAFRTVCDYAGQRGVTLLLENHWGLTGTAAGVLRILQGTDSPWLRVALDTGNFVFCPDPYAEMAALAPHTALVHAKTYIGGGLYYTADLDYRRIGQILSQAGFRGYLSIESEGQAPPDEGLRESRALLRRALADSLP